ncbi:MBL fold metallo-hydrolase [Candidatus Saccharibacteria bacterium]|nr:MBL fold metallo-hydrolase [Candidatus Saccharibacteria bacterium]
MEFQFHGANCISISTPKARVVIDDNLASLGLKSVTKSDDVVLSTVYSEPDTGVRLFIAEPGEYEVSGISVFGVAARAHMDELGKETAIMYKLQYGDFRVAITGHIHPDIKEEYIEDMGAVDVLIVPVGGNGYTLDGIGALSIVKKFDPKIVIPVHYADKAINYPVPQQELSEALKGLAMTPKDSVSRLKLKPADLSEGLSLIVLER